MLYYSTIGTTPENEHPYSFSGVLVLVSPTQHYHNNHRARKKAFMLVFVRCGPCSYSEVVIPFALPRQRPCSFRGEGEGDGCIRYVHPRVPCLKPTNVLSYRTITSKTSFCSFSRVVILAGVVFHHQPGGESLVMINW